MSPVPLGGTNRDGMRTIRLAGSGRVSVQDQGCGST